jgi:hypothetical protein
MVRPGRVLGREQCCVISVASWGAE